MAAQPAYIYATIPTNDVISTHTTLSSDGAVTNLIINMVLNYTGNDSISSNPTTFPVYTTPNLSTQPWWSHWPYFAFILLGILIMAGREAQLQFRQLEKAEAQVNLAFEGGAKPEVEIEKVDPVYVNTARKLKEAPNTQAERETGNKKTTKEENKRKRQAARRAEDQARIDFVKSEGERIRMSKRFTDMGIIAETAIKDATIGIMESAIKRVMDENEEMPHLKLCECEHEEGGNRVGEAEYIFELKEQFEDRIRGQLKEEITRCNENQDGEVPILNFIIRAIIRGQYTHEEALKRQDCWHKMARKLGAQKRREVKLAVLGGDMSEEKCDHGFYSRVTHF